MKKKLLLLSAKRFDIPFVHAAQNMGFYVITTGNKEEQPAHQYSDEYVPFNYMDLDGMVELAKKMQINAVCQGCTDACALTAAYLGENLNLKGHDTYKNAQIIHHKDKFKEFAGRYNIRSPKTVWFTNETEAFESHKKLTLPVIVKPVDLGGGQGISVANNIEEFKVAVEIAFKKSIIGHIVVEPFIEGTLHSMSTFLVQQKVVAYGTANDYSYINPYLTNTGIFPANRHEIVCKVLISEVEKIAKTLGLVDGLLHLQYIMDKNGSPWIIEMMRRSPGNNFLSALSNSIGLNWYEWIVRAESGENSNLIPHSHTPQGYFGYHSIMADRNGIFVGLDILPEFRNHIIQMEQFVDYGYEIKDYLNEKLGSIQYSFSNEKERDRFLPKINAMVHAFVSNKV